MKLVILKYKHYLILLMALLMANYVIVPLDNWQNKQQETLGLLSNKYNKTQALLNNNDLFNQKLEEIDKQLALSDQMLFNSKDEATFKQIAQSKIESVLTKAECKIERIGFKGNAFLQENIERWSLEIRYRGDATCLLKTTRGLESMEPYVRIDDYNVSHSGVDIKGIGEFNASLNVSVWYKEKT